MSHATRAAAILAVLYIGAPCLAQQPRSNELHVIPPKKDDKTAFRCEAIIRVEPAVIAVGDTLNIACEAKCNGDAANVFNGFLWDRLRLPARIVVTSSRGDLQRNVLHANTELPEKCDSRSWVRVSTGRAIGRKFAVRLSQMPEDNPAGSAIPAVHLPPGDYHLQAIYTRWFLAAWPNDPSHGVQRTTDQFPDEPHPWDGQNVSAMDEPIAISEPVKLTVAERKAPITNNHFLQEFGLRLELECDAAPLVTRGPQAQVVIRVTNPSNGRTDVFNPLLDDRLSLKKPMELALLSAEGKYIGNYLDEENGHSRTLRRGDWISVGPGGTLSTRITFNPRSVPLVDVRGRGERPPGKYFLELRGHQALIQPRPAILDVEVVGRASQISSDPTYVAWTRFFPGPEICRSNRVELEILPRTGD